jgi:hypothetical protein
LDFLMEAHFVLCWVRSFYIGELIKWNPQELEEIEPALCVAVGTAGHQHV